MYISKEIVILQEIILKCSLVLILVEAFQFQYIFIAFM